jgi:hypothetical protein
VISTSGQEPPSAETIRPSTRSRTRSSRWNRWAAISSSCFFASAAADSRPGPVRRRLAGFQKEWLDFLIRLAREAQDLGQLDPAPDPAQVGFELYAMLLAANSTFALQGNGAVFARAREAIGNRLAA